MYVVKMDLFFISFGDSIYMVILKSNVFNSLIEGILSIHMETSVQKKAVIYSTNVDSSF